MNNAEIADKLGGMTCMGATLTQEDAASGPWLSLCQDSYDREDVISFGIPEFVAFCRAVVERVDGPVEQTDIERIIYALQLWMKRIVGGIPAHSQEGWEVRWERLEKVIADWKMKGEMPK